MATLHIYRWNQSEDTIWSVCARFVAEAGAANVPSFVEDTRVANSAIHNWLAVPDNTRIVLPYRD